MGAENRHGQSSYRKSCPISIYDVAAVETWLEDLARKGENPVCFTGSRVDLLLDEPWECRFRLQPLQRWKEALDPGGGIPEHGLAAGGAAGALLGLAVR